MKIAQRGSWLPQITEIVRRHQPKNFVNIFICIPRTCAVSAALLFVRARGGKHRAAVTSFGAPAAYGAAYFFVRFFNKFFKFFAAFGAFVLQ